MKISREALHHEMGYIFYDYVMPRDAATLIFVDRSAAEPQVLMGRRHARHVFLPGKYVFPGGRVEAFDYDMPVAKPLSAEMQHKLLVETSLHSAGEATALPLAAIRETFEETGLVVGAKAVTECDMPSPSWAEFVRTGYLPDPSALSFFARAITPVGYPRRFDARFFCADVSSITHRLDKSVRPDDELLELNWLPISAARKLELSVITGLMLLELQAYLDAGAAADPPVPFYCMRDDEFCRAFII
jgi:8-oxo-dGTP pyrophosphatase MutT (NUDIX family)